MVSAFIDTSSLYKKYVDEKGRAELYAWLERLSEIYISPLTYIELYAATIRRMDEKVFTESEAQTVHKELEKDIPFFKVVQWTQELEEGGASLIQKFRLRSLDSIQLAAAVIAKPDIFLTSDKRLFNAAQVELKNAVFI